MTSNRQTNDLLDRVVLANDKPIFAEGAYILT